MEISYKYTHIKPKAVFDFLLRQLYILFLLISSSLAACDADGYLDNTTPSNDSCAIGLCGLLPCDNLPDRISACPLALFSAQVINCMLSNEYPFESSIRSNDGDNILSNPDSLYSLNNLICNGSVKYRSLSSVNEYVGIGNPFLFDRCFCVLYDADKCPKGVRKNLRIIANFFSLKVMHKYTLLHPTNK